MPSSSRLALALAFLCPRRFGLPMRQRNSIACFLRGRGKGGRSGVSPPAPLALDDCKLALIYISKLSPNGGAQAHSICDAVQSSSSQFPFHPNCINISRANDEISLCPRNPAAVTVVDVRIPIVRGRGGTTGQTGRQAGRQASLRM